VNVSLRFLLEKSSARRRYALNRRSAEYQLSSIWRLQWRDHFALCEGNDRERDQETSGWDLWGRGLAGTDLELLRRSLLV